MWRCACYFVELDLIFVRVGVRHYIRRRYGGKTVKAGAGIRPRIGVPWPPATVPCPLLCQFIGLRAKRLCLTAKFHHFSRLVPCGRAVRLGKPIGAALLFQLQIGQLVNLLAQHGLICPDSALSLVLNHQRCCRSRYGDRADQDDFEFGHGGARGQHPKNWVVRQRTSAPFSRRGECADPALYSQELSA